MKKNLLVLALFILVSTTTVFSQSGMENPVKWEFKTEKINDSIAELHFIAVIQDKWHLYAQQHNNGMELPLKFIFNSSPNFKKIGKVWEPKPIVYYDPVYKDTSLYFDKKVIFKQIIQVLNNEPFNVKGELTGQACIEGRCVAIDQSFAFSVSGFEKINIGSSHEDIVDNEEITEDNKSQLESVSADGDAHASEDSILLFFLFAFLGGLAGLLMPCVFPMIPMTISYFLKMEKRVKSYALFFGISIVIIFLLLGILLSIIFGPDFANIVSTHWLPNIIFAAIFVIFAISLFGYFEIALPSSWINKSAKMENTGGLIGVFFMALTLVLVSFSCTLPIAGAVALNSVDGSFFKPIIGMLGFSLGIAVPFTLFAFFPGMLKTMPKSGGWMNTMKVMLAFVELAFALKFLNVPDQTYGWRILDREIYLAFWIVIFAMMGFYLLGKIRFPHDEAAPVQKSWFRYILSIFTFSFVVYLIPGMFGAPLKAISGWLPPMTTQDFDISKIVREETATLSRAFTDEDQWEKPRYADKLHLPHGIFGYFDLDQALQVAKKVNRPVFIDFTGHGCVNCRNVESAIWADSRVRSKFAQEFVVVAQYVDDKVIKLHPEDQILDNNGDTITMLGKKAMFYEQNRYKENSQPCYIIADVDGTVLTGPIYYELNVENYLKFLDEGVRLFRKKN
ncbi:MAG: thioredoxin family protein [Bacteroidales bacterium]|jgi:thiol:disulfide interchange protein DsbD|nr:thioredoxin family protein [Bacteroidales bacterium]